MLGSFTGRKMGRGRGREVNLLWPSGLLPSFRCEGERFNISIYLLIYSGSFGVRLKVKGCLCSS